MKKKEFKLDGGIWTVEMKESTTTLGKEENLTQDQTMPLTQEMCRNVACRLWWIARYLDNWVNAVLFSKMDKTWKEAQWEIWVVHIGSALSVKRAHSSEGIKHSTGWHSFAKGREHTWRDMNSSC